MQKSQVYSLPIGYQDLRKPLALKDIFSQLEQLNDLHSDVLNRLQTKITQQVDRIHDIDARVVQYQDKVNAIAGR